MDLANILGLKNNFKANPYAVNASAFTDPNLDANKKALALALAKRQEHGIVAPQATAATVGPLQAANEDGTFRGDQNALVSQLQTRAAGAAPSVAEMQLHQGLDQAIAAQHAQAASARGISPGLAARLAANNIANAQQATNADAAMLRANEQTQAQNTLGQVLAGARGQDIGVTQFNAGQANQGALTGAGFQQQTNLANQSSGLQAGLQNQAGIDDMTKFYVSQGLSLDQAQLQAKQALEALKAGNHNAIQGINAGVAAGNASTNAQLFGAALSAGGAALGKHL